MERSFGWSSTSISCVTVAVITASTTSPLSTAPSLYTWQQQAPRLRQLLPTLTAKSMFS